MISRFFARVALSIAALLVMVLAAFIAVGFFAFALYLFLATYMAPPVAALMSGVLILMLAVILVLATRTGSGRRGRRGNAAAEREARETAAEVGGELGRKIQGFADAHRNGSLIAALIAGFAVGVSPKLREFLQDILRS